MGRTLPKPTVAHLCPVRSNSLHSRHSGKLTGLRSGDSTTISNGQESFTNTQIPWYLLSFSGLGWRWVLVWFIWFCCCCLYTWVGFVWFFPLFTPPGFPGSLSSHLAQYRNRKALLHLALQLARTSCIQDLKHTSLHSC